MSNDYNALIVGVGDYPEGLDKLRAVATDVRAVADLLGSQSGTFDSTGITLLDEANATGERILRELRAILGMAGSDRTVFIYMAGHGIAALGGEYYFAPYDVNLANLPDTGIALATIKELFDRSSSERLFLWLDFCHSGGILSRGLGAAASPDEMTANLARSLRVVRGRGKVIMCACTASQEAFESPRHGHFTQYLLAGLRGAAANSDGEVTPGTLHEYIDRRIGSPEQRPMFFGQMEGRMVLAYARGGASAVTETAGGAQTTVAPSGGELVVSQSGDWILLDQTFFHAAAVRQGADSQITVQIVSEGDEDDALIRSLKDDHPWQSKSIAYAHRNDAGIVHVRKRESESANGRLVWTLVLEPNRQGPGTNIFGAETGYQENGKRYSADDIAELRARRLLLNDPPASETGRGRPAHGSSMLEIMVQGLHATHKATGGVLPGIYSQFRDDPKKFMELARLAAIFALKATNVFEHVLELTLGPIRDGKLHVRCRGKRHARNSNAAAKTMTVEGDCPLDV